MARAAPALLLPALSVWGAGFADAPPGDAWSRLQRQYYADRSIALADADALSLETPSTTPDPSATPLTVRLGDAALGRVRELRIFIDNNPSPLAATLDFAPSARIAQIELRVRVDRWTSVRAVAEMTGGELAMRSTWVNAAGGCSAAPTGGGSGALGDIRFRGTPDGRALQVAIRHPNNSGFQIDPVSGDTIPAHYVTHIRFSSAGQPLLDVESGISLSENPTIRIASDTALPAPVNIDVTDSKEAHFSASWHGPAGSAEKLSDAAAGNR